MECDDNVSRDKPAEVVCNATMSTSRAQCISKLGYENKGLLINLAKDRDLLHIYEFGQNGLVNVEF